MSYKCHLPENSMGFSSNTLKLTLGFKLTGSFILVLIAKQFTDNSKYS